MENRAHKLRYTQPSLEYGTVTGENESCFSVHTDTGELDAERAVSCMISPQSGDIVLLTIDSFGNCYILAILERGEDNNAAQDIVFEGPVNFKVRNGGLRVTTSDDLVLASENKLSMASQEFEIHAGVGSVRIEKFSFFGKLLHSQIEKIKVVADAVDSIFRRSVQRLTSSYRYIEEHEEVQSASTRMLVDGTLTMQTKNTVHTAEEHVKIDAEQIHLG